MSRDQLTFRKIKWLCKVANLRCAACPLPHSHPMSIQKKKKSNLTTSSLTPDVTLGHIQLPIGGRTH